ncbi:hypothetical protein A3E49_03285 [Candidatus Saccharibacteria bacterium RIFCSPHIGHO2_12_FULL_49_19]|nr:MAG: hypothetical protein A3E49_03285 [Candidatus Saccharibacteria bacterium RIFCSPHIGHO2_12_FULL_49_19]
MRKGSPGFTIVELLLATAVFSLVLVAAVSGFLEIGRLFYKGVTTSQTQNVAKLVLNQITADIQDSTDITTLQNPPPNAEFTYLCIGNKRYTLNFDVKVNTTITDYSQKKFGILRDELPGNSGCAEPCYSAGGDCEPGELVFQNPQELLSTKMSLRIEPARLLEQPSSNPERLYNVRIRLVFGDDDVLRIVDPDNPTGSNVRCDSNLQSSQFCAEAEVSNVVFAGEFGP